MFLLVLPDNPKNLKRTAPSDTDFDEPQKKAAKYDIVLSQDITTDQHLEPISSS